MQRLRQLVDLVTKVLCCFLLSAMVIFVTWQVFSRFVLNDPSTFTEEILRFGVIWFSLIGSAYVCGKNKHMSVDLFKDMLTGRPRWILDIIIQVFFIIFGVAILIVGGGRAIQIAAFQYTAVLHIPMGVIYAALPVSGVLYVLYSLLNIADLLVAGVPAADAEVHPVPEVGE